MNFHSSQKPHLDRPIYKAFFKTLLCFGLSGMLSNSYGIEIHEAIRKNDIKRVKRLINQGVYVNTSNEKGSSLLHLAARFGHPNIVLALTEQGADVNATNYSGETPLHLAAWYGHLNTALTLIEQGADVNATNYSGETPSHYASWKGYDDIAVAIRKREKTPKNCKKLFSETL